jgi:hypothetical protein
MKVGPELGQSERFGSGENDQEREAEPVAQPGSVNIICGYDPHDTLRTN